MLHGQLLVEVIIYHLHPFLTSCLRIAVYINTAALYHLLDSQPTLVACCTVHWWRMYAMHMHSSRQLVSVRQADHELQLRGTVE